MGPNGERRAWHRTANWHDDGGGTADDSRGPRTCSLPSRRAVVVLAAAVVALVGPAGFVGISSGVSTATGASGATTATAPVQVSECTTISSPGTYELTGDVTDASVSECIHITASDVVFDGQGHLVDGGGEGQIGVFVSDNPDPLSDVTVRNVRLTGWTWAGVRAYQLSDGVFRDVTATSNPGSGVNTRQSSDVLVVDSTLSDNDRGIYFYDGTNNDATGNVLTDNDDFGVRSTGSSNEFVDNVATENRVGFAVGDDNRLVDNTAANNDEWDVRVGDSNTIEDLNVGVSTRADTTVDAVGSNVALRGTGTAPAAPNDESGVGRYLDVEPTAGSSSLDSLAFEYASADVSSLPESSLDVWRRGGTWTELGGTVDAAADRVVLSGFVSDVDGVFAPLANTAFTASLPTADAGPDRSVEVGEPLEFDASGSTDDAGVTGYEWTFGDGATASGLRRVHTYDAPGTYTVALTVTDAGENTDTDEVTVTVEAATDPDATSPTADAGRNRTVDEGVAVQFDGTGSTDDAGVVSHEWTFGDGATATGAAPTHTYEAPGTNTVALTVTDAGGNTDTDAVTVTVVDATPPSAVIDANRTLGDSDGNGTGNASVTVGEAVRFDGSGSSDDGGENPTYRWEFGDGTTATGPRPAHSYGTSGNYTVALTVTDGAGNADTESVTVRVEPPPAPATVAVVGASPTGATVTRGAPLNASATLANTGELPGTWNVTLRVDGAVLAAATVELAGGENATVGFADVNTSALRPGTHTLGVNAGDDGRTTTLTVEPGTVARHESGVPVPVFAAVAGGDGVLDRSDVLGMVADYADGRPTGGVDLGREQVLTLVRYYASEK